MEPHEQITISEYQLTAEDYRIGTCHHDVSQNREALIAAINKSQGRILDFTLNADKLSTPLSCLGQE